MRKLFFCLGVLVVVACVCVASAAGYYLMSPVSDVVVVHPLATAPPFEWGPGW